MTALAYPTGRPIGDAPALRQAVIDAGFRYGFTVERLVPLAHLRDWLGIPRMMMDRAIGAASYRTSLALPRAGRVIPHADARPHQPGGTGLHLYRLPGPARAAGPAVPAARARPTRTTARWSACASPCTTAATTWTPSWRAWPAQDWPPHKLEFLIYSDGSTDGTEAVVAPAGPRATAASGWCAGEQRSGKPTGLNRLRDVATRRGHPDHRRAPAARRRRRARAGRAAGRPAGGLRERQPGAARGRRAAAPTGATRSSSAGRRPPSAAWWA